MTQANISGLFSPGTQILLLSLGSAIFYTGSMALMKLWTEAPSAFLILIIILAISIGTFLEITALKSERLGMIYVTILACEVGLIAAISLFVFGESFSAREVLGCLLIVCGTALAWA